MMLIKRIVLILQIEHALRKACSSAKWRACTLHFRQLWLTVCALYPCMYCAAASVLCRDEAQKLWAERAALEAVGLKVVCVVHEWIDREVCKQAAW